MDKEAADRAGLVRIDAYVESDSLAGKKKKQNAERQARWRERQKEKGLAVGAVVPKSVVDAAAKGAAVVAVQPEVAMALAAGKNLAPALSDKDKRALAVGRLALDLDGWRGAAVRWLLRL